MGVPPSLCIIMQSPLVACVVFLAGACLSNPLPEDTESQNAGLSMRRATPPPIRRSAPLAMNSSATLCTNNSATSYEKQCSSGYTTSYKQSAHLMVVDTVTGNGKPAVMEPRSHARAFLYRNQSRPVLQSPRRTVSLFQSRIVLLFPSNPVSLFLNRAVPLSLCKHPPRWPSRCVVEEDTMDNMEGYKVFQLLGYVTAVQQ